MNLSQRTALIRTLYFFVPLTIFVSINLMCLADEEEPIDLSKVPSQVRSAILKHVREDQIQLIEIDREDGNEVYDVEFKVDDELNEFSISKSGTFLEDENQGNDELDNDELDEDDVDHEDHEISEQHEENDDELDNVELDEDDVDHEDQEISEQHEENDDEIESYTYDFEIAKDEFVSRGRNPYFILEPGFQIVLADDDERLVITVLDETATIDGVETRIVEERESKNNELVEVSRNYFAMSNRTNSVFYFGEEVDIYKNGKIVKHEGEWLSGENGAKYGLMMPGQALIGSKFYQEYAPESTMDRAEIIDLDEDANTPAGSFEDCLKIKETNLLEPGVTEYKLYAPGIGIIQDESLKLVRWSEMEEGKTKKVSLSDAPDPVRASIEKLAAGGEIKQIIKTEEDEQEIYDLEAFVNGTYLEYDIASNGSVLSEEESISFLSAPKAVRATARKFFGSLEDFEASKVIENGNVYYEVQGEKNNVEIELKISEDGQIVEEE